MSVVADTSTADDQRGPDAAGGGPTIEYETLGGGGGVSVDDPPVNGGGSGSDTSGCGAGGPSSGGWLSC